jgi:hypothetical protein
VRHIEPLNSDELRFLKKKEERDRHYFYRAVRGILVICFVLPFIIAWIAALYGLPNAFGYRKYFTGVAFLVVFSGLCTYISYYYFLRKVQQDIRHHTKTIERTQITQKKFMPLNGSYYFYIDSDVKLSIEVTEQDFHRFEDGDEVNIEYTTYSRQYLGYF